MRAAVTCLFVAGAMLWLDAPLAMGQAKHRLTHGVTDAFKMFEIFPVAIAIFDTDFDGDLECLTTVRTNYNEEGHTVTYTWLIPGLNGHEKKNITFNLREGASPDKPVYTPLEGDVSDKVANFIYTDYNVCTVLEIPYKTEQVCILWVTREAVSNVPQNCVDYYEDICDTKVEAYNEESCSPVMANL
ncbi:uncharacterized protein LOC142570967 [Dermacentor variabilis]|uniref:uncharacterized protein LOC142570967 n=1 Tax=Dermacentor variabilis TaxID=34621 RepID=UPI003F5C2F9F